MQIYEKLIIEIDFSVSCWQDGEQICFQYKLSKQITCFAFKIMSSLLAESNADWPPILLRT